MILTIDWGLAFRRDLLAFTSIAAAAGLCKAIMRFAETGEGAVEQIREDSPRWLRLRAKGAVAYLFVDEHTQTVHVRRAFPRSA